MRRETLFRRTDAVADAARLNIAVRFSLRMPSDASKTPTNPTPHALFTHAQAMPLPFFHAPRADDVARQQDTDDAASTPRVLNEGR